MEGKEVLVRVLSVENEKGLKVRTQKEESLDSLYWA